MSTINPEYLAWLERLAAARLELLREHHGYYRNEDGIQLPPRTNAPDSECTNPQRYGADCGDKCLRCRSVYTHGAIGIEGSTPPPRFLPAEEVVVVPDIRDGCALIDRIKFLAEHPEVEVQSFNAKEAQEFVGLYSGEPSDDDEPQVSINVLEHVVTECMSRIARVEWEVANHVHEGRNGVTSKARRRYKKNDKYPPRNGAAWAHPEQEVLPL